MEEKKLIRKEIFKRRKACTDGQIDQMSLEITKKVLSLPEFISSPRILAYADYNHEARTCYIIEEAWKMGKEVAVPKVVGKDMIFYKLTSFDQLSPGYYDIPEPAGGETADWEDALIVMPGVAFDKSLNRVGYGGGFYDRYLEKHPGVFRVAIAFDLQLMPKVPTEPTDIAPQVLVTEKEIFR